MLVFLPPCSGGMCVFLPARFDRSLRPTSLHRLSILPTPSSTYAAHVFNHLSSSFCAVILTISLAAMATTCTDATSTSTIATAHSLLSQCRLSNTAPRSVLTINNIPMAFYMDPSGNVVCCATAQKLAFFFREFRQIAVAWLLLSSWADILDTAHAIYDRSRGSTSSPSTRQGKSPRISGHTP